MENGGFGVIEDLLGGIGLFGGARDGGVSGVDESAQERLVADNLDIVLNAWPVRNAIYKPGDVTHIPDCFQFPATIKFLDKRDHVDRPRGLGQIHHARINSPV